MSNEAIEEIRKRIDDLSTHMGVRPKPWEVELKAPAKRGRKPAEKADDSVQ